MRQHSMIAFVGMFALLMGGCTIGDTEQAVSPSPVGSPSAAPVAVAPATTQQAPGKQNFTKPTVAAKPAGLSTVPGLIPATNSDVRARQIQKGRKDPFALIPVQPRVQLPPIIPSPGLNAPPLQLPPLPPIPPARNRGNNGGGGRVGIGGTGRRPTVPKPPARTRPLPGNNRPGVAAGTNPGSVPPAPFLPKLPPLPEPTLARNVEVTGVVEVGGVPQAIVKAPNESSSRYVGVGQRLSNGQVLVKRIEMNDSASPVVILEQYGREVAKRVGEKATPEQPQQASVPSNPTLVAIGVPQG